MFNEKPYVIVIDRGGNLFKIKEKTMQKCFDKIIAPLDIINQIGNESEMELVHELNIDYSLIVLLSLYYTSINLMVYDFLP